MDRHDPWARRSREACDDYLCDPWTLEELRCRCANLCRSVGRVGSLTYDRRALYCGDARIAISLYEHRILDLLVRARGDLVEREVFRAALWTGRPFGRSLDVRVAQLRRKLQVLDPGSSLRIRAVRSRGYCLES
ncbi:MAG: response regulator transcription factor [Candidatus Competibacteraceae bacterium]|nr:response regulator transcription factor [Candidatus Competibacteraceae bacterium]